MSRSIKELLATKALKKTDMKALTAKESDDSPMSDEDVASFNALKAECDALEARIARLRSVEDEDAADADEVAEDAGEKHWTGDHKNIAINVKQPQHEVVKTKGGNAGQFVVGCYIAKEFGRSAGRDFVNKHFRNDLVAKAVLSTSQPVIPQDFSLDWIHLMQEKTVLRPIADIKDMSRGNLTIPRQNIGSIGTWMGEAQPIGVSNLGYDNIQLLWHKMGALSYTSRELLEFTPLDVASQISEDLTSRLALLEDRTFLNSPGGSFTPTGLLTAMLPANKFPNTTVSSAVTFQSVAADLQTAELLLTGNLVQGKFTWIMHPAVKSFLKQISSSFGVFPFAAELANDKLNGHDVKTTVQLPTNLGTSGANLTNVMLVCGQDVIIGDAYRFALSMTTDGSFVDSGTQVNAFGQDVVAFKATNSCDIALKHNVAVAVIQATNWTLGQTGAGFDYYVQTPNTSASGASSAID